MAKIDNYLSNIDPRIATLNLTPTPSPPPVLTLDPTSQVQGDAQLSPLRQEEERKTEMSEEEKLTLKDWADQVEESKEKSSDIEEQEEAVRGIRKALKEKFKKGRGLDREKEMEEEEKSREIVRGLRLWHDLKPRRVRAMCAWVGEEETDLSLKPGAVVTGVRPAAWLNDGWLEGDLDGKTGLFRREDVEYL